jgi:signal transduction histidine kinase
MVLDATYPQLVSLAAHELRTPASVIAGYLRMLERDTESPLTDRQRQLVADANKSCARLVDLIAEMSAVSKLDTGLIAMATRPIDLFSLVGDVVAALPCEDGRPAPVALQGPDRGAPMSGDADRLRAGLDAIVRAIAREKVEPTGLAVGRRVVHQDGQQTAVIVIAEQQDIAGAYDAARAPFDEYRGGLGLSLPIARRVIEAHAGRIWSPLFGDARAKSSAALISFPLPG